MSNPPEWYVMLIFWPFFAIFRDFRRFSHVWMHLEGLGIQEKQNG